jgi:hypothetical protein
VLEGEELTTWDTSFSGEGYLCTHPHKVEFILNWMFQVREFIIFEGFLRIMGRMPNF